MKRAAIALVLGVALLWAAPAQASKEDARIETKAQVLVLPGNHVFRNHDPIKICFGAYTNVDTDEVAKIAVEWRVVGGHGWYLYGHATIHVNKVRCTIASVENYNDDRDMIIRTRVIQSPVFARSERRVYVEVA